MINFKEILKECTYKTSRSGGAGGQHVNKVETKVGLYWNVKESKWINVDQKELFLKAQANKIDLNGILSLTIQKTKSQIRNKRLANQKLIELIRMALKPKKKRRKTKLPKAVKEKRLKVKRIKSETKSNRKKVKW